MRDTFSPSSQIAVVGFFYGVGDMKTWIYDDNRNRCSVEVWGSEEKAMAALATLEFCFRCSDCSDCSQCSDCFRCSDCSDCFRCSSCSQCSQCFRCSDCSDCSQCSDCFRCSDCSDCFQCCEHGSNEKVNVPKIENIHQLVHKNAQKSLSMSQWHSDCGTVHCRAGWVTHLAGEEGKALEDKLGPVVAAMLIYDESSNLEPVSPVRFFETREKALADMKRMAELEAGFEH